MGINSLPRPTPGATNNRRPMGTPILLPASLLGLVSRTRPSTTDNTLTEPDMPSVNSNSYVHGNTHAPPPPPQASQHFGYGAPPGYAFRYSQCTGRRKALLIGINYFGQRGQLRGCINDVKNMSGYLVANFNYKREDMVILTDDQQNPMSQPTKQNILRAMHWLVKDARSDDALFFHYSGKSARPSPSRPR